MSIKTKLKSQKLATTNNTFDAKVIPYQVLDENQEIAKALADSAVSEKEKKLLETELEKPYNKRNKALMNKYSGHATEVLNGWPDDVGNGGYVITATALDDKDIPMEQRPQPWYVKIPFKAGGNSYLFKFPLKKESSNDGAVIYKLDGYNTWIYEDGTIIDSINDGDNIYRSLLNFTLNNEIDDILLEYIVDESGKKFFNFKMSDFYVKYTRNTNNEKKTSSTPSTSPGHVQKFISNRDNTVEVISGKEVDAVNLFTSLKKPGIDIGSVNPVKAEKCIATHIAIGVRKSKNIWLYFDRIVDGVIESTILSGAEVASKYLGLKNVTVNQISTHVDKNNASIRKEI